MRESLFKRLCLSSDVFSDAKNLSNEEQFTGCYLRCHLKLHLHTFRYIFFDFDFVVSNKKLSQPIIFLLYIFEYCVKHYSL